MERNIDNCTGHHRSSSAAPSTSSGANNGTYFRQSEPGSDVNNSQPPSPSSRVNNSTYFSQSMPPGFDLNLSFSALDVSGQVDPRSKLMHPPQSLASSASASMNKYNAAYVDRSTQHNDSFFPSSLTSNVNNINVGSGQRAPLRLGYTMSTLRPTMNNVTDHYMPPSSFTNDNYPVNPSLHHVTEERSQKSPEIDLVRLAMDQHTISILLDFLDNQAPHVTQFILWKVMSELGNLSLHHSGSAFVEKLIGIVPATELGKIVTALHRQGFKRLCTNQYGNQVMQRLVRRVQWHDDVQVLLIERLRPHLVALTKTPSFIDCCLDYFNPVSKEMLLVEMANHLPEMTTNASGCKTLKKCFPHHASYETHYRLVYYIVHNAHDLAVDSNGNYILQHVIEQDNLLAAGKRLGVARCIAAQLKGCFVTLSMDIRGSNVVEKLIKSPNKDVPLQVLPELMRSPEDLLMILQDEYGNFVAQTAYHVSGSEGDERLVPYYNALKGFVKENAKTLKNNKYGRIVLRNAEMLKNDNCGRIAQRNVKRDLLDSC